MKLDYLTKLLGLQGYRVITVEQARKSPGYSVVRVTLERTREGYTCGGCGKAVAQAYDHTWQELRHLTIWQHQTILRFPRYRVICPDCGVRIEALDFADVRGPRVTRALASFIHELCKVTTVKAVARLFGLHRHTVKAIDKKAIEEIQANRPLDGITVVGMDEIAVGKGHDYWTLVSRLLGPRGPEMLYVVEGRSEKHLKRFWRWFGKERAAKLTHAVIDMCRAFENSFRAHCSRNLKIIYDKFHVVRHLNEALNTVRKSALRKALGRFKRPSPARSSCCWRARPASVARLGKPSMLSSRPARGSPRRTC